MRVRPRQDSKLWLLTRRKWLKWLQDGNTALHYAALNGRTNVVQTLIGARANLDVKNKVKFCCVGMVVHAL
jgi:hypothetical protein